MTTAESKTKINGHRHWNVVVVVVAKGGLEHGQGWVTREELKRKRFG
jgi:hypothetical protein